MGVIYVHHPLFLKFLKKLIWVLNVFHFYMPIDISHLLYIFGESGANLLYLCAEMEI